jgi:hypothetical protein
MITYHSDDTITLRGYAPRPIKLTFRAWLNATDQAVAVVEAAFARGIRTESAATQNELDSKRWLEACWERRTHEQANAKLSQLIADWKSRRHLADLPADPSRIIRCRSCNAPLSDPVSKLLGMGPVCRDPRKAAVRLQRAGVAA